MRNISGVLVILIVGALSGCGDSDQAASPATVTVIERTVTANAPAGEPVTPMPSADEAPHRKPSGATIRVPDVVGKDHQLAQDTMQAAGLYNLAETDATGQGRALLFDRNWTVVSQSPEAGTRVSEDRPIMLRSKKDDE
jgi:hypothetical protein